MAEVFCTSIRTGTKTALAGKGPKRSREEAEEAVDLPLAALAIEGAAAEQPEPKQVHADRLASCALCASRHVEVDKR